MQNSPSPFPIAMRLFHGRAIQKTVGGIPRPKIDLSAKNFARAMDAAFGYKLNPPFDPYANSLNVLLASYFIPYLGINGYVGTNPIIDGYATKHVIRYPRTHWHEFCETTS